MVRIGVLDDYQKVARQSAEWREIEGIAEVVVFDDHIADENRLVGRLRPFDVLCVMRERTALPGAVLRRLPRLRMIATTGAWNAAIDLATADELGIVVSGTSSSETAAAELTWALILASARHLPTEFDAFRRGAWQKSVGLDLHGRTLGVLGLGQTGSRVANYGKAFGMRVIAWSQNMTPEKASQHCASFVSKDELLSQSDFLSVHVRLSDRTRGLIGVEELRRMKSDAWLINTSRGPIVDEDAFIRALQDETIGGAALDVFDCEPLPSDHAFRRLKNVVGTSHIGYVTDRGYAQFYGESVQNILAWIKGAPIRVISHAIPESSAVGVINEFN